MNKFVNPKFASRNSGYLDVISKIQDARHCPFCKGHFNYHKKPILKKRNSWLITENSWPYPNSRRHFIILNPLVHKEKISEVTPKDMATVLELIKWAVKKFKIQSGGICFRFGETRFTGATVNHLHVHLIIPKTAGKKVKTVNFSIG